MPNSSCITTRSNKVLSGKGSAELVSELEKAIVRVSDLILQEPLEKFQSDANTIENKFQAVVEYGKLVSDYSKLVHFVTRMSLQHNLSNDKRFVEQQMLYSRNNSECDLSVIDEEIQSLNSRIDALEGWVK